MSDTPILRDLAAEWTARRTKEDAMSEHRAPPGWEVDFPMSDHLDNGRPDAPDPADGGHPPGWPAAADPDYLGGLPGPGQIEDHLDGIARTPDDGLAELRVMVDELDRWLRERGA